MWHEGLSIDKIANFPGRSAPIKEQTVVEYLLEAAQEGLSMDWKRFCHESGLTGEMLSDIQSAILKVGSKEKLKPIKNELPEDISYSHIKICLAMMNSGVSQKEAVLSDTKVESNDDLSSNKRLKVAEPVEGSSVQSETTESSILEWIRSFHDGVTLSAIKENFNETDKDLIIELVSSLEAEFLIYKKNDMYKAM